jgi:hypothetical protein
MLRRRTFVPELNVLLLFVMLIIAVPVALVAAVVEPITETKYDGAAVPIPTAPAKVEVAVEVATILPTRKRPIAVVDANTALDVAVSEPKPPVYAAKDDEVALTITTLPLNVLVPEKVLLVVVENAVVNCPIAPSNESGKIAESEEELILLLKRFQSAEERYPLVELLA